MKCASILRGFAGLKMKKYRDDLMLQAEQTKTANEMPKKVR